MRRILESGRGLATRQELMRAGLGQRWLRRRVLGGQLNEPLPGVLHDPRVRLDDFATLQAAVLFAGADAAVSHQSALWVWGLLKGPSPQPMHVAVPRSSVRRHQRVSVHQRALEPVERHLGLPVVSVREALVGAATCLDMDELRFPAMQAVVLGLVTSAELADPHGVPRRSLKIMRMLAEEAAAGAESGGEAKYWRLVHDSPLPTPELQAWTDTHRGRKRIDAYWRDYHLGAEIDSREFHAKELAFEADLVRQNAVHAVGTLLIRFSVRQVLSDPEGVLHDTEMNLRARGWSP